MTDEFFFITFGGLGVSLAGFAGLIHALDRSESADDPITRWRIRSIVSAGLGVALSGLLVWPVYRITTDVAVTARVASALLFLQFFRLSWTDLKPGPAWPEAARWRLNLVISGMTLALMASNVIVGSVGFLEVLFVLAIGQPVGTFLRAVGDLHSVGSGDGARAQSTAEPDTARDDPLRSGE